MTLFQEGNTVSNNDDNERLLYYMAFQSLNIGHTSLKLFHKIVVRTEY